MPDRPRILVIDDDREIVRGLAVRLRAAGYDVLTATDGPGGLHAAVNACLDAIVLDIRMPGMDGLEVLTRLKRDPETSAIPVVVVSANVVETARVHAVRLGAARFLEKPFKLEELLSAVESILAAREPAH